MEYINNILAVKNSTKIEYLKFCVECGKRFISTRTDKLSCSDRCKQRINRRNARFLPYIIESQTTLKETDLKRLQFDRGEVTILDGVKIA